MSVLVCENTWQKVINIDRNSEDKIDKTLKQKTFLQKKKKEKKITKNKYVSKVFVCMYVRILY